MKNLKLVLAVVLTSFGLSAQSAEIGGSVGVGTDYIFRGVSQMDDFAISGDVHVEHKGISAGVWASQVDYGTEIDIEYDYWAQVEFGGEHVTVTGGYIDYALNIAIACHCSSHCACSSSCLCSCPSYRVSKIGVALLIVACCTLQCCVLSLLSCWPASTLMHR